MQALERTITVPATMDTLGLIRTLVPTSSSCSELTTLASCNSGRSSSSSGNDCTNKKSWLRTSQDFFWNSTATDDNASLNPPPPLLSAPRSVQPSPSQDRQSDSQNARRPPTGGSSAQSLPSS